MSQSLMLSPPSSPRDHRLFIPRRPSPLSLPPLAPHLSIGSNSSAYQPFSLTALVVNTPKSGSKVPRYPLEKQRKAWKELEEQQQQKKHEQQMQRQPPMQIPQGSSSRETLSPTSTLPLTPRSAISSASSRYSQQDEHDENNGKSKTFVQRSLCAALFSSCFTVFRVTSRKIENINMRQVMSAR